MPTIPIYIRKENYEKFKSEPSPGELINDLLTEYYAEEPVPILPDPAAFKPSDMSVDPRVIKTPQDATQAVKQIFGNGVIEYCKNGHAKRPGAKTCNTKGCYSK